MQDIPNRIDSLSPEFKKATRDLIPTYRGNALRVEQHAEARTAAIMNPTEMEFLGQAMGLKPKPKLVVNEGPTAMKSQLIRLVRQPSSGGCPGWRVGPSKTLVVMKFCAISRKVDAATEHPLKTVTLINYLTTKERYSEKPSVVQDSKLHPLRIVPKRL